MTAVKDSSLDAAADELRDVEKVRSVKASPQDARTLKVLTPEEPCSVKKATWRVSLTIPRPS